MHATLPRPAKAQDEPAVIDREEVFVPAGRHALRARPVLLALDGTAAAEAAARVTADLVEKRGARPHVIRATSSAPFAAAFEMSDVPFTGHPAANGSSRYAAVSEVRAGLRRALGYAVGWPVHVEPGPAPVAIAQKSARLGAAITVLGLRPHRGLTRLFHDATVLGAARESAAPLLAVTAGESAMPRRIIVGVDFGRAGLLAARWAIPLLETGGTIILAYVAPNDAARPGETGEGARVIHAQGVAAAFARLRAEVGAPRDVTLASVVLHGDPAAELLSLADRSDASCIAVGSRRHETMERWLLGSVTADLAHAGTRSLLVVPSHRA